MLKGKLWTVAVLPGRAGPARYVRPRPSIILRTPFTERLVVAAGSDGACVSIVSVRVCGQRDANRLAIGISPSPRLTNRRAALE